MGCPAGARHTRTSGTQRARAVYYRGDVIEHAEKKMSSPAATPTTTRAPQTPTTAAATTAAPPSASPNIALQTITAPSPSPRRASAPQTVLAGFTPPSSKRRRTEPATKAGVGYNIGFIGCGNMARALVEGMLASGSKIINRRHFAYTYATRGCTRHRYDANILRSCRSGTNRNGYGFCNQRELREPQENEGITFICLLGETLSKISNSYQFFLPL